MLEAKANYAENHTEQAILRDGSLIDINEARITIKSICNVSARIDPFGYIDRLFELRVWADDLQAYIDTVTAGADEPFREYRKRNINETLRSPIFEVNKPDSTWTVPPQMAVAVLRNLVCVNQDGDGEIWLQEPFANRTELAEAWESVARQ
jgi:hypothetical protein